MDSWGDFAAQSPLTGGWESFFTQPESSTGWWQSSPAPYAYGAGWKQGASFDYDPGGYGSTYGPMSGLTQQVINSDVDQWLAREHPELFDFTAGWQQGGVAGAGNVARNAKNPNGTPFGQFHKTPEVYDEIQSAAAKYGVPANFLQTIIAQESSGDWEKNNWVSNNRPQSGGLLPYVGVYKNAADSRGLGHLWQPGNRAAQIELLAGILRSQYDQLQKQNPQYGWLNVASYHYSGRPVPDGWTDEFQNLSNNTYMATTESWWKMLDAQSGNTWSNYTSTGMGTGVGSPNNREWAPVNQWDQIVAGASQKYGVPANLIKAVMRFESGGNASAVSPQGATGLMQVMPFHVGGNQSILFDPQTNIDVGTRILMDNYRRHGSWEMAAKAYLGLGGADAHGTTSSTYWQRVNTYWQELNGGASGMYGAPGVPVTTTQMEAIWGGVPHMGISQEHAQTSAWTRSNPGMYSYGRGLGVTNGGHPGIDIIMMPGVQLYSPGSGIVERISNDSYADYSGSGPNRGGLYIRLDNGHMLILGHIQSTSVNVGDRVTAGTPVARSGKYRTDRNGHLHLEYRIPVGNQTDTGWAAVNPRDYLGGTFSGVHQGAKTGLGYTQPLTFQNLMRAAASGQEIPDGPVYSMGGGRSAWTGWLRQAMQGNVPSRINPGSYTYTYSAGGNLPPSY